MSNRHKHADLIHAWCEGAEIEHLTNNGGWESINSPKWLNSATYRIKPEPKLDIVRQVVVEATSPMWIKVCEFSRRICVYILTVKQAS